MSRKPQKRKEASLTPYEAPRVTRVSLRPEEAVLGSCKISGAGGPNIGPGTTCAFPGACNAPTS